MLMSFYQWLYPSVKTNQFFRSLISFFTSEMFFEPSISKNRLTGGDLSFAFDVNHGHDVSMNELQSSSYD